MPVDLKNRVGVRVVGTPGTGTIQLGSAIPANAAIFQPSWQTFSQGGVNEGSQVRYLIYDAANWEYGPGTYTAGTLIRPATAMDGSVAGQKSSIGILLPLTHNAEVFITAIAEDFAAAALADGDKGDVIVTGGGSIWTIDNSVITDAKLSSVPSGTIKGRVSASTGPLENLNGTQATTLLSQFGAALQGVTPPSGGGTTNFLRADGSWTVPANTSITVGTTALLSGTTTRVLFDAAGVVGENANFTYNSGTNVLTLGGAGILAANTIDLGAADTTLSRASAGTLAIEGVNVLTAATGQPLDPTLSALAAFNSDGILVQTAPDSFTSRTLSPPSFGFTISNPNGIGGNPTFVLANDLAALEGLTGTNTIYYRSGVDAWSGVTMGINIQFSGGALNVTSEGANPNASYLLVNAEPNVLVGLNGRAIDHVNGLADIGAYPFSGAIPLSSERVLVAGTGITLVDTGPNGTLTINGTATISLAGENYLSIAGSVLTANPVNLSGTNVTGNLPVSHLAGGVGASGTTFWCGNGSWATPPGSSGLTIGTTTIGGGTSLRVLYDNAGALGEYTNVQLTALIQQFTSTLSGAVPLSGGGTANFLRADGSWVVPPGSGGLTVGTTTVSGGTTTRVLYDNSGALGEYTNTQLTALLDLFSTTTTTKGVVPGANNLGGTYFLRGDGTWGIPAATGGFPVMDSSNPNWYPPTSTPQFIVDSVSGDDSSTGQIDCSITDGSISGTVLTVVTVDFGTISVGDNVIFLDVPLPAGLTITSFGTGTGGAGTYNLSANVGSVANIFGIWTTHHAVKTIQAALNYAATFSYQNMFYANFVITAGTYSEALVCPAVVGNRNVQFILHFPSSTTIDATGTGFSTLNSYGGESAKLIVNDASVTYKGESLIFVSDGGNITINGGVAHGTAALGDGFNPLFAALDGGQITIIQSITVELDNPLNAGVGFIGLTNYSEMDISGITMTFSGTPDLEVFVSADRYSVLRAVGTTFSGAVDAAVKKFALTNESMIVTDVVLASWPGSIAGTHDNWSHYDDIFPSGGGGGSEPIVPKSANYTILHADAGSQFTNDSASGAIEFTLPDPTVNISDSFGFFVEAAQALEITTAITAPLTTPPGASIVVGTRRFDPTPSIPGLPYFITDPGGGEVRGVQSNSDFTRLVAWGNGVAITSIDGGHTWTTPVVVSALDFIGGVIFVDDGDTLLAWNNISNNGAEGVIFQSTDFGLTWNAVTTTGHDFAAVCAADDGLHCAATGFGNTTYVWTSTDGGATWTEQLTSPQFVTTIQVACNSDGSKLVTVEIDISEVYISNDNGATWAPTATQPTVLNFIGWVACSSDGQHLITGDVGVAVWYSDDRGLTWTQSASALSPQETYFSVRASGANGSAIATSDGTDFWLSADYGHTWTIDATFTGLTPTFATLSANGHEASATDAGTIAVKEAQPDTPAVAVTIQCSAPDSHLRLVAVDTNLWVATSITGGPWMVGAVVAFDGAPPVASVHEDTIANILLLTPAVGAIAFATDIQQTLIADGTRWQIDSSYYSVQGSVPSLGANPYPNRVGYGRDYVTDKVLANCWIGQGRPPSPEEGTIRFNSDLGQFGQYEQYSVGDWHPIVVGLVLTEVNDISQAITQTPIGQTQEIIVFNGDSVLHGLNGVPITEGYISSMGSYPPLQTISGGTF